MGKLIRYATAVIIFVIVGLMRMSDIESDNTLRRIAREVHGVKTEPPTPLVLSADKQRKVAEMMRHAWNNYKLYAWGKDELKPMSKRAHLTSISRGGDLGTTIVNSMDTLYLMGMNNEFQEGRDWIANHFHINDIDRELSVFETTVHFVGGFLSCYALTGDTVFRDKAVEVADALLPAFDTPTGIPYPLINPSNKALRPYYWAGGNSILSEVGALHMEFTYLSEITGNNIYREKVARIRDLLHNVQKPDGLYPNFINPRNGLWGQRGMFALASTTLQNSLSDRYMDVAKNLTQTCHEAYDQADTKLSPETFRFSGEVEARALKYSEKMYLMRPDTFESYFILWRLTKDQKYRDWGWEAVQALEKYCRVEGGYTGLQNVYQSKPLGDDVQQSWFLAQTLKYLYLLFSDDSLLPLDEWVFNTEAHPFPIKDKNPLYRAAIKPAIAIHEDNSL
ncbi:jg10096 [Pararge aegeria aegeria]|uniref:alpha-1,2-Mannosidase n=1 Tax=Pararge aegeria aegeria TaxID=348720 RepID=A0A8S4SKT8_9NEOP|nr:jg10096 [Pararge aegeria aegeria]